MNNEETKFLDGIKSEEIEEKKDGMSPWKWVSIGGVAGILMGAGSLYSGQVIAKKLESDEIVSEDSNSHTIENGVKVADVDQSQSFGEAFAAARAEVGPGGVFHWHGGIYNTYTEEEWNSMSRSEKNEFAQQVKPEISVDEVSTPTDANTHVIVEHHVYHHVDNQSDVQANEDVQFANQQSTESDSDVHIVGYGEVQGHAAVSLDMNGDGQADVAIIDVDDSGDISNPDVMVDRRGNMATIGELANANDPNMTTNNENPDMVDGDQVETDYPLFDV